ncbi:MAG: flagellar type III secretion system pore protein FliP [Deltaproteobacteria bacterium]|nr:flagellar type III secretion system pore protein FliP [Deltaproteobacteria bacterium]MBI3295016.1 flagellar type III secretion system pore protein FliP [Deltaproteobacteria bacterium]
MNPNLVGALTSLAANSAVPAMPGFPSLQLSLGNANSPEQTAVVLKILALLTILSLAPSLLIMLTSFVRIVIVLSFLRQAIGTQVLPPNQLIVGLSLFLTFFVMAPVWKSVHEQALMPYLDEKISGKEAIGVAEGSLRQFMFKQTRDKDLGLFVKLAKVPAPGKRADVPTYLLVPAFMISELKTAFQIGFMIYIPFLVLDMVVASILMAMGMMMLPPVIISLPFKLILFVLVDGWQLIIGSLVRSFG